MTCFTVDCPAEACYVNPLCSVDYQNRVIGLAFVKKSVTLNKTTAALWLNSLLLAEVNGDAVLVRNTSGDHPAPDTAELPGFGRSNGRLGPKTHTITAADRNGVVNVAAYNAFLQTNGLYDMYFITPLLIWDVSGQEVTINGDIIITNEITNFITGQLQMKWVQIGTPEACEFNDISFNLGLRYVISNAYDPTFTLTVASDTDADTTFTAALNQTVTGSIPDQVWSVELPTDGTEENWIITMDSVTGTMTINAQPELDPGATVTVVVVVTNQYGCVLGEQEFVITLEA